MNNKVWNILKKEDFTEQGIKNMENLFSAIERICAVSKNKDIETLYDGINCSLYKTMDILDVIMRS